jgi:hypothetical protein
MRKIAALPLLDIIRGNVGVARLMRKIATLPLLDIIRGNVGVARFEKRRTIYAKPSV